MRDLFKKKLAKLYVTQVKNTATQKQLAEYQKMVRFGAYGEKGEEYYIFLYRDLYRNSAYYGAIIFIDKADHLGNPVRIHCLEQNGLEQARNTYIRAALYFLMNTMEDTMRPSGPMMEIFKLAKEKINEYVRQTHPEKTRNWLDTFNFDTSNQDITWRELTITKNTRTFESRALREQLEALTGPPAGLMPDLEEKIPVRLALSVKVEFVGLTDKRDFMFQPTIIPLKRNGQGQLTPRKLTPEDLPKIQLMDTPPELREFLEHFSLLTYPDYTEPQRNKILNRLYFKFLVQALLTIPEELRLCQTPEANRQYQPLQRLRFRAVELRFAPSFEREAIFSIRLSFIPDGEESAPLADAGDNYIIKKIGSEFFIFMTTPDKNHFLASPVDPLPFERLFTFLGESSSYYLNDFDKIIESLEKIVSPVIRLQPDLMKKYHLSLKPAPELHLYPGENTLQSVRPEHVRIHFEYLGEIRKFLASHRDKEVFAYDPNLDFESACRELLRLDPMLQMKAELDESTKKTDHFFFSASGPLLQWVLEQGQFYIDKGFRIFSTKLKRYLRNTVGTIRIHVEEKTDWLEFRAEVESGNDEKAEAIEQLDLESRMITDRRGRLHLVSQEDIGRLRQLEQYAEYSGGIYRIPSRNHILIRKFYDLRVEELQAFNYVQELEKKLAAFEKIADHAVGKGFKGHLRDYQHEGFKWLRFLWEYDLAGCLADDMGLGKTVQTLALLQTLKDDEKLKTSLLLAPISAIQNWEGEIEKFTTGFRVYRHLGQGRAKDASVFTEYDIILSSYATLRNDIELFRDFSFDYLILDESQAIKNPASLSTRAIKLLKCNHRLALSGTPIENNTIELWSLFDFLLPGYLGNLPFFTRRFATPLERDKSTERAETLKQMIYPFILRRKKEMVARELPEKTEIVHRLPMDELQANLYAETARSYREALASEIDVNGVTGSAIKILEAMMRLRQICLFPQLADPRFKHTPSAKFDHFLELLEDITSEGHKVLVFSQFVEVLKIIGAYLKSQDQAFSYLDGSMSLKDRKQNIRDFQENTAIRVFLLSLKAGGVAINLTAADYVILFDPWWNPAVEAQAIDRSHRIGQIRPVFVYRMVMENTIEEKMLALQEEKRELVDNLIEADGKHFKNLKKDDILGLFKF